MSEKLVDPKETESSTRSDLALGEIDPVAEAKLVRKLDWALLPLFTLIYAANFIDRTAVGNAKIAGLEKDLGMTGVEYNIALTIFYIFYMTFDVPSNLALKRFGSVWLAVLVTSFGAITIGGAFVKTYRTFVITRVFLGIAESGTLSGLVYVLSRYYKRSELVLRVGIFFGIAPCISGAFGGLLASGLLSINDIGSVTSWRKLFLVEGIMTTGFGLLCFIIIPDDPLYSRLLSPEERLLALARISSDQPVSTKGKKERTTLRLVLKSLSLHTILCAICYIFLNISFQGLSLFIPTVVATLGHYSTVESQLRSVPPYLVGGVWALFNAYLGFRTNTRAMPIFVSVLLSIVGYAMAVGSSNPHVRYASLFFSFAGPTPSGPMYLTWATDNAAPDTVRAVVTALIPGIGALGSIIAVWTYLPDDAPNFVQGNTLNLATSCAVCVLTVLGYLCAKRENRIRESGGRDYVLEGKTAEEIEKLGYLHPNFRYQT